MTTPKNSPGFSIVITTAFESLEYLKLCLHSLKKNSTLDNEILIHVDGSTDGTKEWLESENIPFSYSENLGQSFAVNQAGSRATKEYMIIANDDVYFGLEWDKPLLKYHHPDLYLQVNVVSDLYVGAGEKQLNCGNLPATFDVQCFSDFVNFNKKTNSQHLIASSQHLWAFSLFETTKFFEVGGFDFQNFKYGMCDADFIFRIWKRFPYLMFGKARDSFVYHFASPVCHAHYKNSPDNGLQIFNNVHGVDWATTSHVLSTDCFTRAASHPIFSKCE